MTPGLPRPLASRLLRPGSRLHQRAPTQEKFEFIKSHIPLEGAVYYAQGMGMPVAVGTPQDIADQMEWYMDEGGADGFMLVSNVTLQCYIDLTDMVVPEMQRRGRYRTAYNGPMLRDNLLEW